MKIIGIGGLDIVSQPGESIKTYGLGSCVAVIIIDQRLKVAGMAHIALPDSTFNQARAEMCPGYFANIAVADLIRRLQAAGSKIQEDNSAIIIKLVGGAQSLDHVGQFRIGERNLSKVRSLLHLFGLKVDAEDTGGSNISRTVEVWPDTGRTIIHYNGLREQKSL